MLINEVPNRPLDAVHEAFRLASAAQAPVKSNSFRPVTPKRGRDTQAAAAAQRRKLARLDDAARLLAASPLTVPTSIFARRNVASSRQNDGSA